MVRCNDIRRLRTIWVTGRFSMTPCRRDADGRDAVPSSALPNELVGQDQQAERVLAGSLVAARASGHDRPELVRHFGAHADTDRSILESARSRRADFQLFREALPDDPYHQHSI